MVLLLLNRLLVTIEQLDESWDGSRLPQRDVLFGCVYKVCHGRSSARVIPELRRVADYGLTSGVPTVATLNGYMADRSVTATLQGLVDTSALPLTGVESSYAVDSAVFGNTMKLHMVSGVRTRTVVAAEVAGADDSGILPLALPLCRVPANLEGSVWAQMHHCFKQDWDVPDNDTESILQMLKRRFGNTVRARSHAGRINELYCRVVAQNLVLLAFGLCRRGADPRDFGLTVLT